MNQLSLVQSRLLQAVVCISATGVVLLAGCGLGPTATSISTSSEPAIVSGNVHGGQQPVFNAAVRLYASGTTGYGAGSTLLATSAPSAVGTGNFAFTKNAGKGGVIAAGATPVWQCPTAGDPIIYITAIGGNTQGTADINVNNSASGLLAALGPCSTVSGSAFVSLNEISTVASVTALAQYINPGSTPGTESMGTSSTAQATLGINNAAASITNMASVASGQTVVPPQYAGTGSAAGITVTASAEASKIITIADILAACINTTASTSSQCGDLFNNALPPLSATYTSQPTVTFATATDTIQAAYYMATNPANLGTFVSCSGGATTTTACLFNLASSTSPFQPTLSTQPSDWTIGVTYSATGNCVGGGAFIAGPFKTSVDASGNIWFINGIASTSASGIFSNLSEMSPLGQPLTCLGASANGRGLTIDPTGNVWASFNTTSSNGGIEELPAGGSSFIAWPTAIGATPYTPYTVTSDGVGNIYFTNTGTGGQLLQFAAPLTSTTPTAPTLITPGTTGFNGTATTTTNASAVDSTNRIWVGTSTVSYIYDEYYAASTTTAPITAFSVAYTSGTTSIATFQAANTFTAGQRVVVSGLTSAAATAGNLNSALYVLPGVTATQFSAIVNTTTSVSSTTDAGTATLQTPAIGPIQQKVTTYGLAIDSSNYVYGGTTCCGSTASYKLLEKTTPGANGTGTVSASAQYLGGINGVRSVALDGAANVWVGNEFSSTGNLSTLANFPISEIATSGSGTTATFTALSPTGVALSSTACTTSLGCPTGGGFIKNDVQEVRDLAVDPSGSVWIMNTGNETTTYAGTTIVQFVGAAVPTVTPLSVAARDGKLATKP